MTENPAQIVCFGEILWDNLPSGRKPGGAPMNVAVQAKNLGTATHLISRVGNDAEGKELSKFLSERGLATDFIQVDGDLSTGHVEVELGAGEEVNYDIAMPVAWDNIDLTADLIELVREAEYFIYGSLAGRSRRSRRTLIELMGNANTKVFDLNFRLPHYSLPIVESMIRKSDIVKLNEGEFHEFMQYKGLEVGLEEKSLEWIRVYYEVDSVIITRGSKGAWLNTNGQFYSHSGYKVDTVDPVGSGDAFLAAFLVARIMGHEPGDCLSRACAAGAVVASHTGAVPPISMEILERFIENA